MADRLVISKEEYEVWLKDKVTRAIFKSLKEYRDALKEGKDEGDCLDMESMERSILHTVHRKGVMEGLDYFLDMKHTDEITPEEAYFYDAETDE